MKKLTLFLITTFCFGISSAQITLEMEYVEGGFDNNNLNLVELSSSRYKYQMIDKTNYEIKLYNLDHTLFKTIPIPTQTASNWAVFYISENLFDTDISNIEYLVSGLYPNHYVTIYNETGSIISAIENANLGGLNIMGRGKPIFNTESGTKMILNSYSLGWSRVYSLPGELNQILSSTVNRIKLDETVLSNSYPNPTMDFTRIDYKLPFGIKEGEIVFFNIHGQEIKRFIVDRYFSSIEISTADLPPGTYYYRLNTSQGISEGKKMLKIE